MAFFSKIMTLALFASLIGSNAFAASGVTYHGRILRSDASPVQGQFVGFRMRVMDGNTGSCLMYEETQTKDMRNSGGVFSIVIGDGSVVGTYSTIGVSLFDGLFQNSKTYTFPVGHACEFIPYNAATRDGRKLNVSFRESPSDPWEDMPTMNIEHVPFAYSSLTSQKVGNHGDGSLLRVENAGTPSAVAALTPTQYTNLVTLANGASTQYIQSVLGTASQITVNTAAGVATLTLADVATAGTYGSATQVPVFTLDAKGRITSVTNTTITGAAPTGAAGGDLTGNYPNPDIAAGVVGATELATDAVTTAKILNGNVTDVKLAADSVTSAKILDGTITGSDISSTAALSLASVTATGALSSDSVSTRSMGLFELPANGTNYIAHKAPDNLAGNTTYTWPAAAPGSNMVLQSDATGALSWVAPGSANAYVQNGNAFGAKAVLGTTDNNDLEFITNNTAKMIVKTDGNVGIGTSSPSAGGTSANAAKTYLTLKGSTAAGVLQMTSAAADADAVQLGSIEWVDSNSSDANKRSGYISMLTQGTTANNRGSYMAFATRADGASSALERMKITNTGDGIIGVAGGVPQARFDIVGSTNDNTANALNVRNPGGATILRARNDGNVGIGTTNPGAKLSVSGNSGAFSALPSATIAHFGNADATNTRVLIDAAGTGVYPSLTFRSSRGTAAAPTATQSADIIGQLSFVGYGATGFPGTKPVMIVKAAENWTDSAQGTYVRFETVALGQTLADERMRIEAGGNVGIGTTAPAYNLEVNGTIYGSTVRTSAAWMDTNGFNTTNYVGHVNLSKTGTMSISRGTSGGLISLQNHFATITSGTALGEVGFSNATGNNSGILRSVATETFSSTNHGTAMTFSVTQNAQTTPFEAARIDSTGNVGIGTTNPQTKLAVNGVISPSVDNTHSLGNSSYRFTDIYATGSIISTSDGRSKTNIQDSDLGLDFINNLRPVSYNWKEGDKTLHYGVIAQETETAIREAKAKSGRVDEAAGVIVNHDEKTDRYGVKYTELIAPIIKAIQELYGEVFGVKADVDTLKAENAAQARSIASKADKSEVEALKAKNAKLEKENAEMKARLDKIEKMLKSK